MENSYKQLFYRVFETKFYNVRRLQIFAITVFPGRNNFYSFSYQSDLYQDFMLIR